MKRVFIKSDSLYTENTLIFKEDNLHYLKNVLRVRENERIQAVDSSKHITYEATISHISKAIVKAEIISSVQADIQDQITISIIQGIPKSQKMDYIIQKCTEIGADQFYPLASKRCIPDISLKKDKKIARWQKISSEAAKQSRRITVPDIHEPVAIGNLQNIFAHHDINIILWEEENAMTLKQALKQKTPKSISLTIGPEGGFEQEEIVKMVDYGGIPVTIGNTILRTETAPIAVCAMLTYEYRL
ncbi:MAG: 16S rRNA methyltransferase [Candidatus Margulisiibacteriota bacterium]|nr:MAG: hypothetical protein A2X43_04315 [Candidatus Margulisbacteria bacterium GWD2_39_127]OGI05222.1 MAG: hypothetical protein A2X42_02825 [Candidatus Margulisbacteria bacterium GWF2_38_17]OGI06271.1 MAG: hypothetical protein A2X41_08405 [Candidatus Margulisbacteria bacterium GWE2_39_32]PZM78929.1 MAG: 16S rRNA methyltransferase [Candidatus Margulisiibacteriota bacterium]HAR64487.1 16S rRNA methyltransferase [Candidatus Margulisiibacteriota bacterium]